MTVKEQLLRIPEMEKNIVAKRKRLQTLKELSIGVGAKVPTGMPRNPSPSTSRMADTVCRIVDLEAEIAVDEAELESAKAGILDSISFLDPNEQSVIIERELLRKTWPEISRTMSYSKRNVQYIHEHAMAKIS